MFSDGFEKVALLGSTLYNTAKTVAFGNKKIPGQLASIGRYAGAGAAIGGLKGALQTDEDGKSGGISGALKGAAGGAALMGGGRLIGGMSDRMSNLKAAKTKLNTSRTNRVSNRMGNWYGTHGQGD